MAAKNGPSPGARFEALFDFSGASNEDLPFKKGEILTIQSTSMDPNWWKARDSKGKEGMVPANYLEELLAGATSAPKTGTLPRDASGQLMPMPWFHGKITRELAEELLQPRTDGLYLIRESTNYPGDYTLCVVANNLVDHYRIITTRGKISIDEEEFFDSLEELISHYEKDSDGLSTRLVRPLIKQGGREFVDKKVFSKWEINPRSITMGALLGSGMFGDVIQGTYNGKAVAIKTLKNVDPEGVETFLAEADVMTRLQHPNLVQLIGVVTTGSPIMIVCELMGKGGLLQYLTTRGRAKITGPDQLKFTKDICAGMCYLEAHNFVHRDLACRNILLADDTTAKVADFGLAKDSGAGQVDLGKLPIKWTSPEALRQKVSTSKSDVWSYGVTLWEIYSYGRAPYPKMTQKEVVEMVPKGYRMECPEFCPKEIYEKIILWCWELDAFKRPSFKDLSDKLEKFVVK